LAFATRTASVLVDGFCFGGGAFVNFPPIGVGAFEARPTGCVLIGPVTGLPLGMLDNWIRPNSFKGSSNRARFRRSHFADSMKPRCNKGQLLEREFFKGSG
jgi:hypothetical protein